MSESRLSNRNAAIQEMLTDGEKLKTFYRFVAQNPHISLHDACQIVIERPNASVCFSFDEWNAMGRRISRGRKGIAYYDSDGCKQHVFDAYDTYGDERYKRLVYPIKRLLQGLDALNGTNLYENLRGDYRKIHDGVATYLQDNGYLSEDEERNRLIIEGTTHYLYGKTGFPKSNGIEMHGMTGNLEDNAQLFKDITAFAKFLFNEIEDAYLQKQNEVEVIADVDEETVSDEPVIVKSEPIEQIEEQPNVLPFYKEYSDVQKEYPNVIVMKRLGDFYEMFDDSAKVASEILNLTLTGRDVGLPERAPMCGVPYHAMDRFVEKILEERSVIILENGEEPKYIKSINETPKQKVDEFDVDEEDEPEQEYDIEDLYDMDSEQEEIVQVEDEVRPQAKSSKSRKRKETPQLSIFDILGEQPEEDKENERREEFIKSVLQGGSGVEYGKFRIMEKYQSNPSQDDFASMLKKEYGTGGRGYSGFNEMHDSNGIRAEYIDKEYSQNDISISLRWNEVASRIADLIDDGEYLSLQEQEEYKDYLAERTGTVEERNNAIAKNIIKRLWNKQDDGYFRVFGTSCYAGYGYVIEHSAEIVELLKNIDKVDDVYFKADDFYIYGKELASKNEKVRKIVDDIVQKGTEYSEAGNYIFYFSDFGEDEQFVREHSDDIVTRLERREEVSDVILDDEAFDVNYYTDYLQNYMYDDGQEDEDTRTFNRFKELTPDDKAFFDSYSMRNFSEPTVSMWDEVQHCNTIANGIYEVSTAGHGGVMIAEELAPHILSSEALQLGYRDGGYYCYEEDCAACIPLRELYDKGILTPKSGYFTHYYVKSNSPEAKGGNVPFNSATEAEKAKFIKLWNKTIDESLQHWNGEYWKAREQAQTEIKKPTVERQASGENTDLNAIGFDQAELGGAKARFKGNVEAIRLLKRLENDKRNPTIEEQKTLAKYVGWGGLAKAFDEHDESWRSEYCELISLLSTEDYENAKSSVLNAHYTSKTVIDGIYKALARFGVMGNNRILEPAMGTGNFFGFMPKEMQDNARLYGVELDGITGRLATKLYPKANIQVKGFEQTTFPNDHFDIVVGNVPFGAYTVYDSEYARHNFYIHDYFLAKSIDKLKPNGLMAVITSSGTMDKLNPSVRKYLAERAELLGAIRLPNNAFLQTAGTQVVADILFFKKREQRAYVDTENTEWLSTGKTEQGYEINNYFIWHPEMVLGELTKEHGMYGAFDVTVKPDGRNLAEALEEAVSHLPENFYETPVYDENAEQEAELIDYDVKPLCYKAQNGKLYMRIGERMEEQEIPTRPQDAYNRICEMINLRNELRYVLDIQLEGCSDERLAEEQRKLNANYDRFVRKYGLLNSQTNTRLFRDDADSALLFACEDVNDDKKTATKADIFSKRTIRPYVAVVNTDDCYEALQICKNERGRVDIAYIEEITRKDYDTVISELGNAIFRNPSEVDSDDKYTGFETSEEYLSGRVVDKLRIAEDYARVYPELGYDRNIEALKGVQPETIKASDISVRLGASWVDEKYYKQFICELLDLPYHFRDGIQLYYNEHDSSWRIDKAMYIRHYSYMNVYKVYGTERADAYRLIADCLNLKATTIYDTVDDGDGTRRVLNKAETIAAREKQNSIKEAFKEWIYRDPQRREELEQAYNAKFNRIKLPTYDGSYLQFPEMNPAIELKPHQKNAVHRIITSGNTLLHHVVGSGKTYTICATIMKLRQYGLAKKPMIAVPNHLVQQWASEFRKLYPKAKLLIASKEDLDKNNRKKFVSRVAMGDWDAVIIAQSSFAKIPISTERQIAKIRSEIERIETTIQHTWEEKGMPRGAIKNLEKIKKNRKAQLEKLLDSDKKDNVLIFENLGVDYLFIDEAHYYKNKFLFTKMNNVAGISTAASQRASDLEMKCEYINELHGGDKGVVFATGTPISNSMTEMYTMQSYLQPRTLQELGITYFDGWAADFGETVMSLEMTPSGQGYKPKTRFSRFTNLPELLTLYRSFADVQTSDMVKLDVPDVERKVVTLKPSDDVLKLADEIAERAERISSGDVAPEIDNMLKVTSDGKKLALDPRCYEKDSPDESGSKLNVCAVNIAEIWNDTQDTKATQIVFCDLSTPKKAFEDYVYGEDFDVYNDLKYKLVERGIPEEQIAFIHDANTDEQKQALFDKVNSGTVRVLIGSTEKCGAGTNVQERLIALHHLDTPYRPSDMQQREGRIIRQGNTNKHVKIFTYVKERTFDSYSYQILENKQRFISQIDRGDLTVREADDIDETTLTYAEIKAITAANPKIKRKMEVDTEVARLRVLEGQYKRNLFALQDKIRKTFPENIHRQTVYLEHLREDIKRVKENYNSDPEAFSISVLGKIYTDKREGGLALQSALTSKNTDVVVAEYAGFKISLNPMIFLIGERSVTLAGVGKYEMNIGDSAIGLITRLDNFFKDFPEREQRAESRLEELKHDMDVAREEVEKPFTYANQLQALLKEQIELNAELDIGKKEEEVVIDDGKEDSIISDDENGMALPVQKAVRKKKPRMQLTNDNAELYKKQQDKNPEAYVFIRNGDCYEIYGERAKELSKRYDLPLITEELDGKKETVLSLDEQAFDLVIPDIAEEGHRTLFIEQLPEIKEDNLLDNEDKVATMEVAVLPDYAIDQEDMHSKGYTWDGMLPLRKRAAKLLFNLELPVSMLNGDDTDKKVSTIDEVQGHEGIFGIEKPDWIEFINSDKGKAYLTARHFFAESMRDVLNDDMSYFDGIYVDSLSDINYEERVALNEFLQENGQADVESAKSFVPIVFDNFTDRFRGFPLEEYGWEIQDVRKSLANHIKNDDVKDYAMKLANGDELNEKSEAISAEQNTLSLEERVKQSVDEEYQKFYAEEIKKTPEEIINTDSYKIHFYNEMSVFLREESGDSLTDRDYQALLEDSPNILSELYDYFIWAEYASINTYSDDADLIMAYNDKYHKAIVVDRYEWEESQVDDTKKHSECAKAIDDAISQNFDGMHLNENFEDELIDKYGLNEIEYVLANTVQSKSYDGRFSSQNKDWAQSIEIGESENKRRKFIADSHPAVVNGFVDRIRNKQKEMASEKPVDDNMLQGEFLNKTKYGYSVVNIMKDADDRNIAIIHRKDLNDYIVAARYDTSDGQWAQGEYVATLEIAEQVRAERYGNRPIIYENKEWNKMPEKEKINWIEITTSQDARIKKYEKSSLMRMPTSGEYNGYTYFVYNDRIRRSTQIADLQSDSRELAITIRLKESEVVHLRNGDMEEVQLSANDFKKLVGGTFDKDYIRKSAEKDKMWTTIRVPNEAMRREFDKSTLFAMPKTAEIAGYSFYVPNAFVSEDEESNGERVKISVPDDFMFSAKNKDGEKVNLSAYQVFQRMNNTKTEDYAFERMTEQTEDKPKEESRWKSVAVDEKAKIVAYDERTMFRMPKGEYDGYCYYIPNGLVKTDEEKGTVRINLPEGFVVKAINRQLENENEQQIDMSANDFIAQVEGKTADDYTVYSKPSESKSEKFAETEKKLRERIPDEMKNKPNWVIVRTKPNEVRGRLDKYLIDIHTGKMAKSDEPTTWATFDEAMEYAKHNGGVALAYALDGKDGIACIDLDDCFEESGDMKPFTADLYNKCDGFYCEKSVSGKGLHIFGKTQGMDVRTFSKDGEMEFYRDAHFIAMTGDDFGGTELKSFDEPQIKSVIESKCAKRTPLVGKCAGVEGLSYMSDREVVERAENGKDGERFKSLYSGQDIHNDHSRSDMSLMNMLAFWCNGDKEQMLRIFATSGLYRPEKSDNYYECTVIKAIRDTVSRFQPKAQPTASKPISNSNSDKGGK